MPTKQRCCNKNCIKKIKLTDYPCKCNKIYCINHRLPEEHDCDFNFKQTFDEIEKIVKELKVIPEKTVKI